MNPRTSHPVIDIMEAQKKISCKGGTMRLGAYPCQVAKDSKLFEIYGSELISERHRHRFEFNNKYREMFSEKGMDFGGISPDGKLVESVEIKTNKYFVGVQYHPEYKSTVANPHPLFVSFVAAAVKNKVSC
jgi:CTP synthase